MPLLVRVGGVLEAAIGIWALVTADRAAATLVAASYLGVHRLRARRVAP